MNDLFTGSDRTLVMGIINATPDSFSDGGLCASSEAILAQATKMIAEGADIIDIGGESTRPFSEPVPAGQEIARVLPAIKAIRASFKVPISIDTTKATVASAALAAGADIINDISALRFDPDMLAVAREADCPLVIMHMQGNPKNMQVQPQYADVVAETKTFLAARLRWLRDSGITAPVAIDPGIGFGKTIDHNLSLIRHLPDFTELGCPVLVGHSRKSFIGSILGIDRPADRDQATACLAAIIAANGAKIIRTHNVAATLQAARLADAVRQAS